MRFFNAESYSLAVDSTEAFVCDFHLIKVYFKPYQSWKSMSYSPGTFLVHSYKNIYYYMETSNLAVYYR